VKEMSYPNIPDITPDITIDRNDVINILLASIGLEELSLAHLTNAEAEKIQFVLGTLYPNPDGTPPEVLPDIEDVLRINRSVERTLRGVIKNQMLMQFKLEDVLDLIPEPAVEPEPSPIAPVVEPEPVVEAEPVVDTPVETPAE